MSCKIFFNFICIIADKFYQRWFVYRLTRWRSVIFRTIYFCNGARRFCGDRGNLTRLRISFNEWWLKGWLCQRSSVRGRSENIKIFRRNLRFSNLFYGIWIPVLGRFQWFGLGLIQWTEFFENRPNRFLRYQFWNWGIHWIGCSACVSHLFILGGNIFANDLSTFNFAAGFEQIRLKSALGMKWALEIPNQKMYNKAKWNVT